VNLIVKLYGTLSLSFENYDPTNGLMVEIPDGSSISDLLVHLKISQSRVGMVLIGKHPIKKEEPLFQGGTVKIFQPIFGG